jgi:hypothetical protein
MFGLSRLAAWWLVVECFENLIQVYNQDRVEPGPNPFAPDNVLTMCPE